MLRGIVIGTGIGLLALAFVAGVLLSLPPENPQEQPRAETAPEPVRPAEQPQNATQTQQRPAPKIEPEKPAPKLRPVWAEDVFRAFKGNERRAELVYCGEIVLAGYVHRVGPDYVALVELVHPGGNGLRPLTTEGHRLYFRAGNQHELIRLDPLDRVIVRGRCEGREGFPVVYRDCRLIGRYESLAEFEAAAKLEQ